MFYDMRMKVASSILLSLICFSVLSPCPVRAEKADPCAIIEEEIVDLRPPEFDRPIRWKRTMGVEGEDRFNAIVPLADKGIVAVGLTVPVDRPQGVTGELKAKPALIYLSRIDPTGKIIWEKRHPVSDLKRIDDAVVVKDKIIVLADVGDKISLLSFNGLGSPTGSDLISGDREHLSGRALISDAGGASVTIAVSATGLKKDAPTVTKLIRRSLSKTTLFKREYLADIPTLAKDIVKLDDGTLLLVGRARVGGARFGGWILHLNQKGDIIESHLFPRGRQAEINSALRLANGDYIASGQILGSSMSAMPAGWVMRLKPDMTPLWQNYIRGDYGYDARRLILNDHGRFQVLVSAAVSDAEGKGGRDHGRVLTYTPEGRMVDVESFIEGSNADIYDMLQHGDFRWLVGGAQTGFVNAARDSLETKSTYDAWVLGLALPKAQPSKCALESSSSIPSLSSLDDE